MRDTLFYTSIAATSCVLGRRLYRAWADSVRENVIATRVAPQTMIEQSNLYRATQRQGYIRLMAQGDYQTAWAQFKDYLTLGDVADRIRVAREIANLNDMRPVGMLYSHLAAHAELQGAVRDEAGDVLAWRIASAWFTRPDPTDADNVWAVANVRRVDRAHVIETAIGYLFFDTYSTILRNELQTLREPARRPIA
jgi:hypothetical protein